MFDDEEYTGPLIRAFTVEDRSSTMFTRLHIEIELPDEPDDDPDGGEQLPEQRSA